jgi:hypothetical protein
MVWLLSAFKIFEQLVECSGIWAKERSSCIAVPVYIYELRRAESKFTNVSRLTAVS